MRARVATAQDAPAIARIYNDGIEDRVATFETTSRSPDDVVGWFDGAHPIVVVEDNDDTIAFGSTSTYRPRECYKGVAEFSVYVAREHRRRGAGRVAMNALIAASKDAGFWKLVSGCSLKTPEACSFCVPSDSATSEPTRTTDNSTAYGETS